MDERDYKAMNDELKKEHHIGDINKMVTAVQSLILQLKKQKEILKNHFEEGKWNDDRCSEIDNCLLMCEQAKELEKQQMIDFGRKCQMVKSEFGDEDFTFLYTPEELYNETYKK